MKSNRGKKKPEGIPGSLVIRGVGLDPMDPKKKKAAEKFSKDLAFSHATGKPMKGYKGLPKIKRIK